MPEQETLERAREDAAEGKAPSTQAGRIRARRDRSYPRRKAWRALGQAGDRDRIIKSAPRWCKTSTAESIEDQREHSSESDERFQSSGQSAQAVVEALARHVECAQEEGSAAASNKALSKQAHSSASKRTMKERSAAGKKAAKTRASEARHK